MMSKEISSSLTGKVQLLEEKLQQKINFLKLALNRLEEALKEPFHVSGIEIDASIGRFEFCFELSWKTLKLALEIQGIKVSLPREVLQAAYQHGLIKHDTLWLAMLNDRNETSHKYDQVVAHDIYEEIKKSYYRELIRTYERLEARYKNQALDVN